MNCTDISDDDLLSSISSILSDYRYTPKGGMDNNHVSRWLDQFRPSERRFVLEETERMLGLGYFAEIRYQNVITELVEDEANAEFFLNAAFLDIQDQGSSQHELVTELCAESTECLNVVTRSSLDRWVRSFGKFVYIDDVSFSGTKAIQDLTWLITRYQLQNIEIYIYFFGTHTFAEWNIKYRLENAFGRLNIKIYTGPGEFRSVENRKFYSSSSGVFWPISDNVNIPGWVKDSSLYTGIYREGYIKNDNFPDEKRRNRFEQILTATGFDILSHSKNPQDALKPLGFSTFKGVGFGGTTFTFRNCPNNTPLAFWWGSYEVTGTFAVDCWYPLMKREVYNQRL
ncbi:phosphoribosyltransferase-like protein [Enterobacter mori]|jgi:hypothetical protein|uniref:phosphoribosyltransferase-like protein n=1 Tax=Enterobacter mori TaxID=539813 RepID=UPI0002DF6B81|nr:hypothetical protein [Enterobacter mori]